MPAPSATPAPQILCADCRIRLTPSTGLPSLALLSGRRDAIEPCDVCEKARKDAVTRHAIDGMKREDDEQKGSIERRTAMSY